MTDFRIDRQYIDGQHVDRALVLTVTGEVDLCTRDPLAAAIREALDGGQIAELIVDFGLVTFCDAGGIGVLCAGRRLADERGVGFTVTDVRPIVRRVMALTDTLHLLTGEPCSRADSS